MLPLLILTLLTTATANPDARPKPNPRKSMFFLIWYLYTLAFSSVWHNFQTFWVKIQIFWYLFSFQITRTEPAELLCTKGGDAKAPSPPLLCTYKFSDARFTAWPPLSRWEKNEIENQNIFVFTFACAHFYIFLAKLDFGLRFWLLSTKQKI